MISYGFSMGGGPGIWLCSTASGREVFACITESAFASTEQLIRESMDYSMEGSWILDVSYPNAARAATLEIPYLRLSTTYLLMHGERDQRVSITHARTIWERVRDLNVLNRIHIDAEAGHRNYPIPSYPYSDLPSRYSHPDEFPPDSNYRVELSTYQERIADFLVSVIEAREL